MIDQKFIDALIFHILPGETREQMIQKAEHLAGRLLSQEEIMIVIKGLEDYSLL